MLNSKLISFLLNYNFKIASIIALFLAILFSILAINLIPLSRDYENYIELFLNAKNAKSYFNSIESTEIIFSTLAFITRNFIFTALVLGLLGLYIKFKFFLYFKSASLVIIFYYLARFFIVLDVTQLRISFGISMLLVGFFVCTKKEYLKTFIFFVLAFISHSTTLVYIPILIFSALVKKPDKVFFKIIKLFIFIIIPIILIGVVFGKSLFSSISIPLDSLTNNIPDKRIAAYFFEEYDFKIPPLKSDFFFFFKIVSLLFLGFSKKQNLDENDEIFYITYRAGIVFNFSIFIFISFHDLYAIASRLSDISAPFECIIIAYFIINFPKFAKNKILIFAFQLVISILIISKLLFSQKYLFNN